MPFPPGFLERPDPRPEFQHFIEAFYELSMSRTCYPGGFGSSGALGFIPVAEIESYCRMAEITDRQEMMTIIRHIDRLYVEFQNRKLTPPDKKN